MTAWFYAQFSDVTPVHVIENFAEYIVVSTCMMTDNDIL